MAGTAQAKAANERKQLALGPWKHELQARQRSRHWPVRCYLGDATK